jgi:hypothetical protein
MEIKTEEWTGDHYRRLLDILLEGFKWQVYGIDKILK